MTRVERAIEQIYGNSSLRDDLDDAQAEIVLRWAEKQVHMLDANHSDDAAFDEAFATLQKVLRGFNRLIGHGAADYSAEQLRDRTTKVISWAREIQLPVDEAAVDAFVANIKELDRIGQAQALVQALPAGSDELAPDVPAAEGESSGSEVSSLADRLEGKLGQAAAGLTSIKKHLKDAVEEAVTKQAQQSEEIRQYPVDSAAQTDDNPDDNGEDRRI